MVPPTQRGVFARGGFLRDGVQTGQIWGPDSVPNTLRMVCCIHCTSASALQRQRSHIRGQLA